MRAASTRPLREVIKTYGAAAGPKLPSVPYLQYLPILIPMGQRQWKLTGSRARARSRKERGKEKSRKGKVKAKNQKERASRPARETSGTKRLLHHGHRVLHPLRLGLWFLPRKANRKARIPRAREKEPKSAMFVDSQATLRRIAGMSGRLLGQRQRNGCELAWTRARQCGAFSFTASGVGQVNCVSTRP